MLLLRDAEEVLGCVGEAFQGGQPQLVASSQVP